MSDVKTGSGADVAVAVVVTEALRPFRVAYVFRVAVLTAVVVGVITLGSVVFSMAGFGAGAFTVVVAVGVARVKRRAFTIVRPNGKGFAGWFCG